MTTSKASSFEDALPCGACLVYQSYTDDCGLLEFYLPEDLHGALVSPSVAQQVRARAFDADADPETVFADLVHEWEY